MAVTQSESRMPAWLPRGSNMQSPMLKEYILEREAESGACPLCNFSCGVLVCGHWDPLDVTCSAAHWLDCLTWVETCIWGSRKGNQLGSYTFLTCLEMRGTRRFVGLSNSLDTLGYFNLNFLYVYVCVRFCVK